MPTPLPRSTQVPFLLVRSLRTPKGPLSRANIAGLSLIECLVAIVVISVTVALITPPIFLATASRIQARRAEQANQIAQQEIDRIRSVVERGTYTEVELPPSSGNTAVRDVAVATSVDTTTILSPSTCGGSKYPTVKPTTSANLVRVDVDGDCQAEFAMQVFRSKDCAATVAGGPPRGFEFGVRVYTYTPSQGGSTPTLAKDRANLKVTTGRSDDGLGSRKPLQALYSKTTYANTSNAIQCIN